MCLGGSPSVNQTSPRVLSNSTPRSTANQATIAALKNAVSAGTVPGSQGNVLHPQSAATIRLHLQQQQQALQQKAASASTPNKSTGISVLVCIDYILQSKSQLLLLNLMLTNLSKMY